jgi:hypothetical protein
MIKLDSSVALAYLLTEDRYPANALWDWVRTDKRRGRWMRVSGLTRGPTLSSDRELRLLDGCLA